MMWRGRQHKGATSKSPARRANTECICVVSGSLWGVGDAEGAFRRGAAEAVAWGTDRAVTAAGAGVVCIRGCWGATGVVRCEPPGGVPAAGRDASPHATSGSHTSALQSRGAAVQWGCCPAQAGLNRNRGTCHVSVWGAGVQQGGCITQSVGLLQQYRGVPLSVRVQGAGAQHGA